jgi:mannose-6-phosphate isomerase-like protein (cupin superfamily)
MTRMLRTGSLDGMRRHRSLAPLSRDHHDVLVRARDLRRADRQDEATWRATAAAFGPFFRNEAIRHFREEEELVFPLLLAHVDEPPPELLRALVEHGRLHALAAQIRAEPTADLLVATGELLDDHVRLEERIVFELVQQTVPDDELAALVLTDRAGRIDPHSPVRRFLAPGGRGPVWGTASDDLNATVLVWPAGFATPDDVNTERDVLLVVLEGSGTLELDGAQHPLGAGDGLVIPKGARRRVVAGPDGIRYLTAHLKRGGLKITPRPK